MIAVALHDDLAVAAILTSCSASIERQLLACECTLNINREPPVFRPGALFDLTLRFLEFRIWLSTFVVGRSSASAGREVILDNLDGLRHFDPCTSHLSFFLPWLERARFYHGRRSGLSQELALKVVLGRVLWIAQ